MKKTPLCLEIFLLASGLQILFLVGIKFSNGFQEFLFASGAIIMLSLGFSCFTISIYMDRDWTYVIPFTIATLYLLHTTNWIIMDFLSFLLMGKETFPQVKCQVKELFPIGENYDLKCLVNGKEKKYKNPIFYDPTKNIFGEHIVVILSKHSPNTILWVETLSPEKK